MPKERGYNEMKRNCLLRVLEYRRIVKEEILRCYKRVKSGSFSVNIPSRLEKNAGKSGKRAAACAAARPSDRRIE